jgi:hypothetical protein
MIDLDVHILVEKAVNSRTKLHLLLIFYEHVRSGITASSLAQRYCRDIWSVKQALEEMAEDGILLLGKSVSGEPLFYFAPRIEYAKTVETLIQQYDDPIQRDSILQMVNEASELTHLHTPFDRRPL